MTNSEVAESRTKVKNPNINYSIGDINRRLKLKIPLNDFGVVLKSLKLNSRANVKMLKFNHQNGNPMSGFLQLQRELKNMNKRHIEKCNKKINKTFLKK